MLLNLVQLILIALCGFVLIPLSNNAYTPQFLLISFKLFYNPMPRPMKLGVVLKPFSTITPILEQFISKPNLTRDYDTVAALIQQSDPLPDIPHAPNYCLKSPDRTSKKITPHPLLSSQPHNLNQIQQQLLTLLHHQKLLLHPHGLSIILTILGDEVVAVAPKTIKDVVVVAEVTTITTSIILGTHKDHLNHPSIDLTIHPFHLVHTLYKTQKLVYLAPHLEAHHRCIILQLPWISHKL